MEVKYIILLCMIVVRQTSGDKMDDMKAKIIVQCKSTGSTNCDAISKTFEKDTEDGKKCTNTIGAYEKTISEEPPTSTSSPMLLWSGCGMNMEASKTTENDYITVDKTIMGQSFTNLRWKKVEDKKRSDIYYEYNEKEIPGYWRTPSCPCPSSYVFWARLSQKFAQQAEGDVYVLLSANTTGGAFKNGSIFREYEVDNLPSTISSFQVYLYHAKLKDTNCDKEDSIQELKKKIVDRKIPYKCTSKDLLPVSTKTVVLSSYSERYDGTECGSCVMKLSTHILAVVSFVHLFIK